MLRIKYIIILCFLVVSCHSQTKQSSDKIVGGPCEGCEAVHEYGDKVLSLIDTLTGYHENEPKLKVEGTIYHLDGKTPASDVIMYVYHTNRNGIYERDTDEKGWGRMHGKYRSWIKTDETGKYTFYTFRPAAYPSGTESEHIHLTVKEPGVNEYYIDSIVFEDDPLLTILMQEKLENRGGSGIVKPVMVNGLLFVKRNIVLGLNIPNY